jgi:hypothetical protein
MLTSITQILHQSMSIFEIVFHRERPAPDYPGILNNGCSFGNQPAQAAFPVAGLRLQAKLVVSVQ